MNNIYIKQLLEAMRSLLNLFKKSPLSDYARRNIGMDFTDDIVCPDDVSCAYAVSTILQGYLELRGKKFPIILGTELLDEILSKSPYFRKVGIIPEGVLLPANTVIVSPRTATVHGHTGIVDADGLVMNNNSEDGLWTKNYDRMSWRKSFVEERGLITRLYQIIV